MSVMCVTFRGGGGGGACECRFMVRVLYVCHSCVCMWGGVSVSS